MFTSTRATIIVDCTLTGDGDCHMSRRARGKLQPHSTGALLCKCESGNVSRRWSLWSDKSSALGAKTVG